MTPLVLSYCRPIVCDLVMASPVKKKQKSNLPVKVKKLRNAKGVWVSNDSPQAVLHKEYRRKLAGRDSKLRHTQDQVSSLTRDIQDQKTQAKHDIQILTAQHQSITNKLTVAVVTQEAAANKSASAAKKAQHEHQLLDSE